MAHTYKLVEANTSAEIDLAYNASTNPYWLVNTGSPSLGSPVTPKFHRPDSAPPELVRLISDIRPMTFSMVVRGEDDDPDELLNNIAMLSRWVDGPDQQAARYHLTGDVNRIELHIKLDGATNTTKIPVVYGNVSAFDSLFTEYGAANTAAFRATVQLYLAPFGEGDAITLRNDLPSSPHFIEDSNSDGVADGWTAINAPTSTALITSQWLIGGKSQQITTNNSTGQGIQSSTVTVTSGTACVGYIWIRGASTSDPITISLLDGSNVVMDSEVFTASNPANYDKTAVDSAGNTWYRYSLSGTNTNANVKMSIIRAAANASIASTFRVDAAYLQTGTSTIPDAWCSASAIYNRNDPVTANPERINYIDMWGVPGDVPGILTTTVATTISAGTKDTIVIAKYTDGKVNVVDLAHWIEGETGTWEYLGGSDSTPSDASRSNGEYSRFTANSTPNVGYYNMFAASGDQGYLDLYSVPHRIFLIARSSSANTTFSWSDSNSPLVAGGGSAVGISAANTWEILDIGYQLPISKTIYENFPESGAAVDPITIEVTPGAASATVDIDAILFLPANEDGLIFVRKGTASSAPSDFVIVGSANEVITSGVSLGLQGGLSTIPPGNKMTRLMFAILNASSQVYTLGDSFDVSLTITPRTRHLLGTS